MSIINAVRSLTFPKGWIAESYNPSPFRTSGWINDPYDITDSRWEQLVDKISQIEPDNKFDIDLRCWCTDVEDQSQIGSCASNAAIGALEMRRKRNGLEQIELSRMFPYYNARLANRAQDRDDGSYIKLILESLTRIGVCPETVWPYDTSKVFLRPSWNAYRSAYAYKINKFYRIATSGALLHFQILQALKAHYPVIFGMNVYESFTECAGFVSMPSSKEKKLGGHAMLIVGVDVKNKLYIVRNSWGSSWAESGYCYIPFCVLEACDADSFWAFTL